MNQRLDFFGLTAAALQQHVVSLGLPKFRAKQLRDWVYTHNVLDVAKMHNLPKSAVPLLQSSLSFDLPPVTHHQVSLDTTEKWLLDAGIETVLIPSHAGSTVCVSSQVGCSLSCSFCHTGTQRLERQLQAADIVKQVVVARTASNTPTPPRNIVFMGQGEPLYNVKNVKTAIEILTEDGGYRFAPRKVTVSTSGIVPAIVKLHDTPASLAVSLHAPTDELRSRIMAVNKTFPLQPLMDALVEFSEHRGGQRVTFEYTLLRGVNDSVADAERLAILLRPLNSLVNLIPYNQWPGSPYSGTAPEGVAMFRDVLMRSKRGKLHVTIRRSMGQDILAACGQLNSLAVGKLLQELE